MKKNKIDIDSLILILLLLQVTLFSFLDIRGLGNRMILLVVLIRLFVYKRANKFLLKTVGSVIIMYFIYLISAFQGKNFTLSLFIENFIAIIYTFTPLAYVGLLSKIRTSYFYKTMDNSFVFINVFYIINYVVMILQGLIPGFLSGFSNHVNNYTPDLMSGLFGYESTSQFGLFSVFVFLYDIFCFNYSNNHKIRHKFRRRCIELLLFISVVVGAALNDNKGVYITILLAFISFQMIVISYKNLSKRIMWVLLVGFVLGVITIIFGIVVSTNMQVFLKISPELYGTIYQLNKLLADSSYYYQGQSGSVERVYMLIYAFTHPETLTFGVGTAYSGWQTSGVLGFDHFGQSDLSSFLCLGGISFVSITFLSFYKQYETIARLSIKKRLPSACLISTIAFFFFYTQPWTQSTLSICLAFMIVPLGMLSNALEEKYY